MVGRERDLALLHDSIAQGAPLITIVGTGGAGKTRLATAVAQEQVGRFDDQVFFVSLAGVTQSDGVPGAIAGVLQVRASADRTIGEAVADALRHRPSLLVLDNFEQILDAAPFVGYLLAHCPLLAVLVTSRSPLRVHAERIFELAPLPVASVDDPGIILFCERARSMQPTFVLNRSNERAVIELCAHLDGLPLAIELAASRISLMTPAALLERFNRSPADALRLLSSGARDAPQRHRALEDTIAWSYDLLTPEAQRLFRQLSIFDAGCTLAAVEAVCATTSDEATLILDRLSALVDLRLVVAENGLETRFRMPETIREFAELRLVDDDDTNAVSALRVRQCDYYRLLALAAQPGLESREDGRWLARLESDYLNLRYVLNELDRRDDLAGGLRMASALGWFWRHSGRGEEGRNLLKDMYRRAKETSLDPSTEADVVLMIGRLSAESGLIGQGRKGADETVNFLEEGLALHRGLAGPVGLLRALESVVTGLVQHERTARAGHLCDEGLALATEIDHSWWVAMFLYSATIIEQMNGDLGAAEEAAERGRSVALAHDDSRLAAIGTLLMGTTHMFVGRLGEAERELTEAYHESLAEGDKRNAGFAAVSLGPVFWTRRDLLTSAQWTRHALVLAEAVSEWRCIGFCLTAMTFISEFAGEHEASARVYGAMRGDFESFYRALPPAERERVERSTQRTRARLGDDAYELQASRGEELSRSLAIEAALTTADAIIHRLSDNEQQAEPEPTAAMPVSVAPATAALVPLSPRETEVLVLLASGRSNQQIADELHLSIATIERHLVNVYRKIKVRRRAEATSYAIGHRLVLLT